MTNRSIMVRTCIHEEEEIGPQSSVLRNCSRFDNRKIRNRPTYQRPFPSMSAYDGDSTSVAVEYEEKESGRTIKYDLPDFSTFKTKRNNFCCSERSASRAEERQENSSRKQAINFEKTADDFYAYRTADGESEVRDNDLVFDQDSFKIGIAGGNYCVPSRLRTLKHRISKLNQLVIARKGKKSTIRIFFSFDVFFVMFSFRYMSRNQFCLDRNYDGPLIPKDKNNMAIVKFLIHQIIRWIIDKKRIQKQEGIYGLPLENCDKTCDYSSVQSSFSYVSDPCAYSTNSSITNNEIYIDFRNYIAPEYVRSFLKSLNEAIDLTPDYIHAHNRTQFHGIESDDDGMMEELRNLHFIERDIKKELTDIDNKHMAELSAIKLRESIRTDLAYMDSTTATDAFYQAVVAIASDNSSLSDVDMISTEGTEASFNVQNARDTVTRLVNQIQSQLPQKNPNETPHDLPQVQQKIMNDLLVLSQNPNSLHSSHTLQESKESFEVSIDLKSSVSSLGCDLGSNMTEDDDSINNLPYTLQRSDSIESFPDLKFDNISNQTSKYMGMDFYLDRSENYESFLIPHEVMEGEPTADDNPNISERKGKTIWTTLLDRRQKSTQKSDRRSPFPPKAMSSNIVSSYLQFIKERSSRDTYEDGLMENFSTRTEDDLDVGCHFNSHQNIGGNQENNNSIEVILKDDFKISRTSDTLVTSINYPDESNVRLSTECANAVPNMKTEIIVNHNTKIGENQKNSYIHGSDSTVIDNSCMHDDLSKTEDNYPGVTWPSSPLIDPDRSSSEARTGFAGSTSPNIKYAQNKRIVNLQSIDHDTNNDSKSRLSVTTRNVLESISNSNNNPNDKRRIITEDSQEKKDSTANSRSPKLSDYWESLLTHNFSPTFDENIENEPIYVVHSSGRDFDTDHVKTKVDVMIKERCELIVKDDPSGRYTEGDYSETNLESNLSKKFESPSSFVDILQDDGGIYGSSEFDDTNYDQYTEYNKYDPFEAARNIPKVFSEGGISLEDFNKLRHTPSNHENPILSEVSDSAETIYFDAENIKLCVSTNSSMKPAEVSTYSPPTLYYTFPSMDYSEESILTFPSQQFRIVDEPS